MPANPEAPRNFLRDLQRDLKIDFAKRERLRWEISSAKGMTREKFRQGVIKHGLKAKEEFVDKLPRIDATEPYEVRRDGLYSRQMDAYLVDFAIDRVRRYTPQDFDPYTAAIIRVIDRTIRDRGDRQVCSICSCPPNNSVRFMNFLTRSRGEPDIAANTSFRLPEDSPPDEVDKVFNTLTQKEGRKVIRQEVKEDGQKIEVKILVCDGEDNFILEEEFREVTNKIFNLGPEPPPIEPIRPERFWLPPGFFQPPELNRPISVLIFSNNRAEKSVDNNSNGGSSGPGQSPPPFSPELPLSPALPFPILMIQNIETRPRIQPESLPLMVSSLPFSKPELSTQKVKEEDKARVTEPLSMFQTIEESLEEQAAVVMVEQPAHKIETQAPIITAEKPVQGQTTVKNCIVFPLMEVEQPISTYVHPGGVAREKMEGRIAVERSSEDLQLKESAERETVMPERAEREEVVVFEAAGAETETELVTSATAPFAFIRKEPRRDERVASEIATRLLQQAQVEETLPILVVPNLERAEQITRVEEEISRGGLSSPPPGWYETAEAGEDRVVLPKEEVWDPKIIYRSVAKAMERRRLNFPLSFFSPGRKKAVTEVSTYVHLRGVNRKPLPEWYEPSLIELIPPKEISIITALARDKFGINYPNSSATLADLTLFWLAAMSLFTQKPTLYNLELDFVPLTVKVRDGKILVARRVIPEEILGRESLRAEWGQFSPRPFLFLTA